MLHTPHRLQDESHQAYRERRKAARREALRVVGHGLNGGISSRESLRNDMRRSGTMGKRTRAYAALMAAWAAKRVPKWEGSRDKDGKPITLVGRNPDGSRRIWLAGVSAQRGY